MAGPASTRVPRQSPTRPTCLEAPKARRTVRRAIANRDGPTTPERRPENPRGSPGRRCAPAARVLAPARDAGTPGPRARLAGGLARTAPRDRVAVSPSPSALGSGRSPPSRSPAPPTCVPARSRRAYRPVRRGSAGRCRPVPRAASRPWRPRFPPSRPGRSSRGWNSASVPPRRSRRAPPAHAAGRPGRRR